jgi:hypothetical protein
MAFLVSAQDNILEVVGGFDGANPQSGNAIIRETAHRFRIRPFNEEGSNDAYYFRFNTKVINHSQKEQEIEFIIVWPALKNHPDYPYDTYYYGTRGNWRWTYASVEDTAAKLHIQVPPGESYVGFYPRYSYTQLENFIAKLPNISGVNKWITGKSYHNRNIWAVRLTDPSVEKNQKSVLLITARNHPYETSGSYITEAMIWYLLEGNEQATQLMQNHVIYFLPMINPDGVALGANQRTRANGVNLSYSVGTDDPASSTLLEFVQQVKPTLWADINSWPHQGDDGMWCTHQWVANGLLTQMPDGTFNEYIWDVSFVQERETPENHLWQWLIRTFDSGGVSLSISWYRRNEQDMVTIGRKILEALAYTASTGE